MPISPPTESHVFRLAARESWVPPFLAVLLVPAVLTVMTVAQGDAGAPLLVVYGFFALIGGAIARQVRRRARNLLAGITPRGVWTQNEHGYRESVVWQRLEGAEWRLRRMGRQGVYATIGLLTHDEDDDPDEVTIGPSRALTEMRVVLATVVRHGRQHLVYEKPAPTGLARWLTEREEHRRYARAEAAPAPAQAPPPAAPPVPAGDAAPPAPGGPPPPAWGSVPPAWGP